MLIIMLIYVTIYMLHKLKNTQYLHVRYISALRVDPNNSVWIIELSQKKLIESMSEFVCEHYMKLITS